MKTRTIGLIAMTSTGARQGSYYFVNLHTGRLISKNHWTEFAMPVYVIDQVHRLARRNDVVGIYFRDRIGDTVPDKSNKEEDQDEDFNSDSSDSEDDDDGGDDNEDYHIAGVGNRPQENQQKRGTGRSEDNKKGE